MMSFNRFKIIFTALILLSASGIAAQAQTTAYRSDCCNADAMKKYAQEASVLDIVGIKLGMTPAQALAAIKAYNPALKIDIIKVPIEHPTANPAILASVEHVPLYIYAHTLFANTQQGQIEDISILMTTPPTAPVVAEVSRFIAFRAGQPVVASNLLQNFQKKYGMENYELGSDNHVWIYGENGRLLPRVAGPDTFCIPTPGLPHNFEPGHEASPLNLLNTAD